VVFKISVLAGFRQSTGEGLDELWKLIDRLVKQPPNPPPCSSRPKANGAGAPADKPGAPEKNRAHRPGGRLKDMSVGGAHERIAKTARRAPAPPGEWRKQELIFEILKAPRRERAA